MYIYMYRKADIYGFALSAESSIKRKKCGVECNSEAFSCKTHQHLSNHHPQMSWLCQLQSACSVAHTEESKTCWVDARSFFRVDICINVCVYICVYPANTYVYICIYIYIYIFMDVYVYIYINTCIFIYTHQSIYIYMHA